VGFAALTCCELPLVHIPGLERHGGGLLVHGCAEVRLAHTARHLAAERREEANGLDGVDALTLCAMGSRDAFFVSCGAASQPA